MIDPAQTHPALTVPVTPVISVSSDVPDLRESTEMDQSQQDKPTLEIQPTILDPVDDLPPGLTVSPVVKNEVVDLTENDSAATQVLSPPLKEGEKTKTPVPETLPTLPVVPNSDQPSPAATGSSVLDILKQQGVISSEQISALEMDVASTGRPIEALLEEKNVVSSSVLAQARATLYNLPFAQLAEIGVSPEAISLLPESVAHRYQILPFMVNKQDRTLSVAMKNPLDLTAIDFVEKKTGYKILPYFAAPQEIAQTIAERYAQNLSSEVDQALKETKLATSDRSLDNLSVLSKEVIREAPITKIVETILGYALKARASDIHIEPQEDRTRIRYRIDGILGEKLILPRSVHDAVLSRVKILSDMKIDEKRIPQDGRFSFVADGEEVDLRVSTLPTVHGEKVVMRLLKKNAAIPSLEELGLWGQGLREVEESIKIPHGIILITGPTGSGKTTTLYSVLHILNTAKVNISTLEDPVEYQIAGVNQVQINPQAGLTFASGLRAFLRQDPNIIMVGEIRDMETADLAIQASLTGHLVFSTLHTNSAAGALPRLMDMGAEPFLVASSLTLSLGQRVVRKINPEYVEEYKPEQVVIDDIKAVLGPQFDAWCTRNKKDPNDVRLYRAKKDRPSSEPDYKGRMAIFEVLKISDEISTMILEKKQASDIEKVALKNGMLLMKQDGYLKALEGKTTIEEVLRVADV